MKRSKIIITLTFLFGIFSFVQSQVLTREDSLNAGLIQGENKTIISGYGNVSYTHNLTLHQSLANVDRVVLFVGHRFNKRISLFTEIELEDAGIESGKVHGSVALEQAFLKFNINRHNYLVAGLFIPRIGIINENHLPTTFNGVNRPYVETLIIPVTWREVGIGFYGRTPKISGLNYSIAILTGLNSSGFTNGTGIKDGRFLGNFAKTNALAVNASLLYYYKNWRFQTSGYFGGSAGLRPYLADSLKLESGIFGTPVGLVEANVQYLGNRFSVKALASWVTIPDAFAINRAYANNTPEAMLGGYLDVSYAFYKKGNRELRGFARYEYIDMNFKIPVNGIANTTLNQQYLIAGLSYRPIENVIIKLDYTYRLTGDRNPALIVTPYPVAQPYYTQQHILNLGVGYNF